MPMAPGGPPQTQPQQDPSQGQDQGQGQGQAASQAVDMIQKGFQQLGDLMQKAQGNLDPDDMKLYQQAVQATDVFLQALTSPAQDEAKEQAQAAPKGGSGPLAANAKPGAQPAPQY